MAILKYATGQWQSSMQCCETIDAGGSCVDFKVFHYGAKLPITCEGV